MLDAASITAIAAAVGAVVGYLAKLAETRTRLAISERSASSKEQRTALQGYAELCRTLQKQIDEFATELADARAHIATMQTQIAALQADNAALKAKIAHYEEQSARAAQ